MCFICKPSLILVRKLISSIFIPYFWFNTVAGYKFIFKKIIAFRSFSNNFLICIVAMIYVVNTSICGQFRFIYSFLIIRWII
nr:MAG TPA: hypothetical protein [Caudoviricetes sp.]